MIIGYILTIIAATEVILGLYFLVRYQKSPTSVSYGLFALGSAVYVGANGLGYLSGSFLIGERLGWLGGFLATVFYLPFSQSFPIPKKRWRELFPWILWPLLLFGGGILFTNMFITVSGLSRFGEGYKIATGAYFWLLLVFLLSYWTWSVTNLIRAHRISGGSQRKLVKYVMIGTFISLAGSLIFDVAIPLIVPNNFGYVGSLLTSAWLGMTAYILVKKPSP